MTENDIAEFAAIWEAAMELYGKAPSDTATTLAFRVLEKYTIEDVRRGLEAHMADPERGQFAPKPADIIAKISGDSARDGRPTADEAWATAIQADDEAVTVVWTEETAHAWGVARPILAEGDPVGARMAFRAAYERAVKDAREQRRRVRWTPSLGHDLEGRRQAIEQAVADGRIEASAAAKFLPPAEPRPRALLEASGRSADAQTIRTHLRALLRKIKCVNAQRGNSNPQPWAE